MFTRIDFFVQQYCVKNCRQKVKKLSPQRRYITPTRLPRDTLDPLAQRRDNQTRKELAQIPECDSCSRLISNDITNNYNLRSKVKESNIRIPMSYTERRRQSFIDQTYTLLNYF